MKNIILAIGLAFLLNFFWEISQAFLYEPHYSGTYGFIAVHIRASLGDVAIIFLIFFADSIIFKNISGQEGIGFPRLAAMIIAGLVLAVLVEKYALLTNRWAYNPLMPIIPFLKVGLTPILQMIIIPPITLAIYTRFKK